VARTTDDIGGRPHPTGGDMSDIQPSSDGEQSGDGLDDDSHDEVEVLDDAVGGLGGIADMLGGGDGGIDLSGLLDQAMAAQQQMAEAQAALAEQVVEGQAGGGVVTIRVTGAMEFREVLIRPDAVDPDDVDMLQDLVLAALHEASRAVLALQAQAAPDLGGMLGGS